MRILAITLTVIGVLAAPSIAESSASRGQCLKAEKSCKLKCAITSDPDDSTCDSICVTALDTCFSFADTLEPPASGTGHGKRKQSPYASDINAGFYQQ